MEYMTIIAMILFGIAYGCLRERQGDGTGPKGSCYFHGGYRRPIRAQCKVRIPLDG